MERMTRYFAALFLLLFPVAYGLLGLHLGQDTGFDTVNYHFFDPYWILTNHFFDIAPAQEQTYLSPILNIPTYLLQRSLSGREASFIIATFEGLAIVPLYLLGRTVTPKRYLALGLATLGVLSAVTWAEIGTSFGDNIVAVLLIFSLVVAAHVNPGLAHTTPSAWLLFGAGTLAGLGIGLKLAEAPIAIGFLAATPLLARSTRACILATLRYGSGLVTGALATYGYWAYELTKRYGNPVLPFFNSIFHSQFAPIALSTDQRFLPKNLFEAVFYPFIWSINPLRVNDVNFRELSIPLCEALLIVALVSRLIRLARKEPWRPMFENSFERYLVVGSSLGLIIWEYQFGIYRYLTPIEMIAFVLFWVLLKSALRGLTSSSTTTRLLPVVALVLVLISVVTEEPANFGRAHFSAKFFTVSVPKQFLKQPTTILMLSGVPYAYVVPFLPADTDAIRLQGNLPPTPYVDQLIAQRIGSARSIYITWVSTERRKEFLAKNSAAWTRFGLEVVQGSCSSMSTYQGANREWVRFCRVAPPLHPRRLTDRLFSGPIVALAHPTTALR